MFSLKNLHGDLNVAFIRKLSHIIKLHHKRIAANNNRSHSHKYSKQWIKIFSLGTRKITGVGGDQAEKREWKKRRWVLIDEGVLKFSDSILWLGSDSPLNRRRLQLHCFHQSRRLCSVLDSSPIARNAIKTHELGFWITETERLRETINVDHVRLRKLEEIYGDDETLRTTHEEEEEEESVLGFEKKITEEKSKWSKKFDTRVLNL